MAGVWRSWLLQPADFLEADVPTVADDDVVEDVDTEQFAGADQAVRERHIVRAGRRVAARVHVGLMWRSELCGRRSVSL